jgi:hypothetical protein
VLSIPREVALQPRIAAQPVGRRAEASTRQVHPADIAQARVFDAVLLGEIAELEGLVTSMEQRWLRRCERGIDDANRPPEALVRMRERVSEAQQLLDALRDRFPSD